MQRAATTKLAIALTLLLALGAASHAAVYIDINEDDAVASPPGGSPPSPTQTDYTGITQTGGSGVSLNVVVGNALDDRDRGPVTGAGTALSDLLRDFVFSSASFASGNKPTIDVTLTGLAAGHYDFAGYIHDKTVDQGDYDFSVSNNGGATYQLKDNNVATTTGSAPSSIGVGRFDFYANGVDDVTFRVAYDSGGAVPGGNVNVILNGLKIEERPGLFVDFNEGSSPTQAGYTSVTTAGATGLSSPFGSIDIGLPSFGFDADRDRGALSSEQAQSDLLRDFIFSQTTTGLDITLSGVEAGVYEFTGYFHDNNVDQNYADILISTDGGSTFVNGLLGVDYSVGTNPAAVGMGRFNFTANGADDVVFRIVGHGGDHNNLINGFDLVAIPTPAALPAGLLLLTGLMMRRK
ncbi:hypothetical protein HED60_04215 [Planctomycetales bacterium ZRK34]|nr:hypothetical protein HED60_04215 [Planctomycetales bacterium ZRK34]